MVRRRVGLYAENGAFGHTAFIHSGGESGNCAERYLVQSTPPLCCLFWSASLGATRSIPGICAVHSPLCSFVLLTIAWFFFRGLLCLCTGFLQSRCLFSILAPSEALKLRGHWALLGRASGGVMYKASYVMTELCICASCAEKELAMTAMT